MSRGSRITGIRYILPVKLFTCFSDQPMFELVRNDKRDLLFNDRIKQEFIHSRGDLTLQIIEIPGKISYLS
jgi:hypothetical protein